MKYKFFSIPVLAGESFEKELNGFLAARRIISVKRELVSRDKDVFWAFCIEYMDGESLSTGLAKKPKIDYRAVLSAEDFAVYSKLRDLRKTLAEKEAVQLFHIFTNEQLAEIVRQKPASRTALGGIKGVGEGTLDKYAEPFLELLKSLGFENETEG
ncbi:MAG: HRDC domain-containing protein [Spirochaetales bacterium]|nr:HRDC domain-containing protein [Spirochaetales bacterium]